MEAKDKSEQINIFSKGNLMQVKTEVVFVYKQDYKPKRF